MHLFTWFFFFEKIAKTKLLLMRMQKNANFYCKKFVNLLRTFFHYWNFWVIFPILIHCFSDIIEQKPTINWIFFWSKLKQKQKNSLFLNFDCARIIFTLFLHNAKKINPIFLIGNAKNGNFSSKKTCHKKFSLLIILTDFPYSNKLFSDIFEQQPTINWILFWSKLKQKNSLILNYDCARNLFTLFLHNAKKIKAVFLIGNAKNANFSSKKTYHKKFSLLIILTDIPISNTLFFWYFWTIYKQKMSFLLIKFKNKRFINFNFQQCKKILLQFSLK